MPWAPFCFTMVSCRGLVRGPSWGGWWSWPGSVLSQLARRASLRHAAALRLPSMPQADLENTLEAEQEYISRKLSKQVGGRVGGRAGGRGSAQKWQAAGGADGRAEVPQRFSLWHMVHGAVNL